MMKTMSNGIHDGANTHIQGQSITLHSLNTMKVTVRKEKNPIPLADADAVALSFPILLVLFKN